jgi:hypothetical protein
VRGWPSACAVSVFVASCLGLWIRAKAVDQSQRGHAERRALSVGLWPPTFWVIGDAIAHYRQ